MTKRREPLTYQLALTEIAARIGWDRAGAICGVTDRAVRYWSDPDCEREIRMIDAERLDRAFMEHGGDHAPFHRLMTLRLDLAARETDSSLVELAASASKESGEAIGALLEFSARPDCPATRRRAAKELSEAIDTMTDGLAAVESAGTENRENAHGR